MLFSDRKNLLSLYNAVNQTDYKNPEELEIVTLENAIYMGMKNDLAFIMDTNLYLYEHQSTYNPNMPLRDLFYICSEYQKLVDKKSLFSSTLQKIPAPNFIEFYNGSTGIADCTELRLSSAFEHLSGEPKLELVVTVFNVNEGHNAELMQHCSMLKEYAQYVAKVRHYAAYMQLNQAVERAVNECIREGILPVPLILLPDLLPRSVYPLSFLSDYRLHHKLYNLPRQMPLSPAHGFSVSVHLHAFRGYHDCKNFVVKSSHCPISFQRSH
jgi:hypothetical protein